ncbi:MAG: SAM-dependent methyltransferase [Herpetosiphonaceae bacterium]|nr:SAM-dependent methyltransferase [Herpetosiphonaceae bacterium]
MAVNFAYLRVALKDFDWKAMFVDELGWSRTRKHPETFVLDGQTFTLTPVAELGGMVVYRCVGMAGLLPASDLRRRIENKVKEAQFEHIIIFEEGAQHQAVFQWIKRGEGAARSREFSVERTAHGDLLRGEQLLQRLSGIAFEFSDLDAEGQIGIQKVITKVIKSLDVEKVTKRFYDEFTNQRNAFQKFLSGIPTDDDQRWYVSVMLNRLMFIYFIQSKHFLDNDGQYLRHKLQQTQSRETDLFYRDFLEVLFFKGFAQPKLERDVPTNQLLGNIPYLNGGLFMPHPIEERYGTAITIPDAAFTKLFAFFDKWRWHLNERPGESDDEIDPDVLGYIFEKYINQKQMGAYYTKEDITGYICRNTIIPALFDKANLSLAPLDLPHTISAYIYPAVKQIDRLPTETDREYAARQARKNQLIADGQAGKIATINEAITANLNLEAMAFDLVPFLNARQLWSFYTTLSSLSILDPTCGSGAFLFAAIKILKPLYEQALDRMALLVERRKTGDFAFKEILDAEQAHANRDYFITKSIVIRNLYGVDIMEEATEVCKLRLFLRLVADLQETDVDHIEPLPDIDFNIRAGNALVGYVSVDQIGGVVRKSGIASLSPRQQKLLSDVQDVQRELSTYRTTQLQLNPSSETFRQTRQAIRDRLKQVNDGLDDDLLKVGYIKRESNGTYNTQPFHWFTAFYEILTNGGFDVVIGNPPWKEYSAVRKTYRVYGYKTETCGNLHGLCTERGVSLCASNGRTSFIVQLPLVSSSRMVSVRDLLTRSSSSLFTMTFDDRPGKLFEGLQNCRSVIFIAQLSKDTTSTVLATTRYQRWSSEARSYLFDQVEYTVMRGTLVHPGTFPKYASPIEETVFRKLRAKGQLTIDTLLSYKGMEHFIFYQEATRYWIKATAGAPYYSKNGIVGVPAHGRYLHFADLATTHMICAVLNSSLFYTYFIAYGDCFHLSDHLVSGFPMPTDLLSDRRLVDFNKCLMTSLNANAANKTIRTVDGESIEYAEFSVGKSKSTIDDIDRVLAEHYGFTNEELDFIINYDIKYRMGRDAEEVEA